MNDSTSDPTKLSIGTAGGFICESKFDVVKENALVVVTSTGNVSISLPNNNIPEYVSNICQAIIDNDGMRSKMQVDSWEAGDDRFVSKYANDLVQLDNDKKISNDPSTWICEGSGDTSNLWLNLSTGYIGGGRKNWDGSGGSGAALDHFIATGKRYPLCVKLGTITPHSADVWSYAEDEDCMVLDPLLAQHLSHWGIEIQSLEKTEKTLAEMEVDINQNYNWSQVLDRNGSQLVPMRGPGYIGLHNIGSSCYMNSVLQLIFSAPELQQRYLASKDSIVSSAPKDPTQDFITQMSKVAEALLTDKYVPQGEEDDVLEKYVVAPRMLKSVVSKGHRDFSSNRQQDASEYLQHLLNAMEKAERVGLSRLAAPGAKDSGSLFRFEMEQRLQCDATLEVKYSSGSQTLMTILELAIPLEAALNADVVADVRDRKRQRVGEGKDEGEEEEPKLVVPFTACLETYFTAESVVFRHPSRPVSSPAGTATRSTRFRTFPNYLWVKLHRYFVDSDWRQKKIDALVDVPDVLDLRRFRGIGPVAGEVLMADSDGASAGNVGTASRGEAQPAPVDESIVAQLVDMGFSEAGSRRAVAATFSSSADDALAWVLEHMEDANFNDPVAAASSADAFDPEMVSMLSSSLGYPEDQVRRALQATGGDLERAADWLFSHPDDGVTGSPSPANASTGSGLHCLDGEGVYDLVGVVCHLGRSTDHGHYVSYIRREGAWVLYNDDKVALADKPPGDLGFLYLYRRTDATESF